jgi:hypothetical protein
MLVEKRAPGGGEPPEFVAHQRCLRFCQAVNRVKVATNVLGKHVKQDLVHTPDPLAVGFHEGSEPGGTDKISLISSRCAEGR